MNTINKHGLYLNIINIDLWWSDYRLLTCYTPWTKFYLTMLWKIFLWLYQKGTVTFQCLVENKSCDVMFAQQIQATNTFLATFKWHQTFLLESCFYDKSQNEMDIFGFDLVTQGNHSSLVCRPCGSLRSTNKLTLLHHKVFLKAIESQSQ